MYLDGTYTDGGLTDFYWDTADFPDKYVYMDLTNGTATDRVLASEFDGYWNFNAGVVYEYSENLSGVVRITNVNDEQCSGEECYFPGPYSPRTVSFGVRYQY